LWWSGASAWHSAATGGYSCLSEAMMNQRLMKIQQRNQWLIMNQQLMNERLMKSVDLGVNPSNGSSEGTREPDVNDSIAGSRTTTLESFGSISEGSSAMRTPLVEAQNQKTAAAQQLRSKKMSQQDRCGEEGPKETNLTALASSVSTHSPGTLVAGLQNKANGKGCKFELAVGPGATPKPQKEQRGLAPKASNKKDTNFGQNLSLCTGALPQRIVSDRMAPNTDVELGNCMPDIPLPKWFYQPPPVDMEHFSCAQGMFEYAEGFSVATGSGNSVQRGSGEQKQPPLPGHCDAPLKIHIFSSPSDDVAFKPGVACKKRIPTWVI